jgi:hypothetical protein
MKTYTLTEIEFKVIMRALNSAQWICEQTYGETEDDEPTMSAADIFEEVCNLEPLIDEAIETLKGVIQP